MSQFEETPRQTLEKLVWRTLRHFNPRGKGCCYMHVGLQVLQQCISVMMGWQCNAALKPHDGWQCEDCFGINATLFLFPKR